MVDVNALTANYKDRIAQCKEVLVNENVEAAVAKFKSLLTPEVIADLKAHYAGLSEDERKETIKTVSLKVKTYLETECPGKEAEVQEFLKSVSQLRDGVLTQ